MEGEGPGDGAEPDRGRGPGRGLGSRGGVGAGAGGGDRVAGRTRSRVPRRDTPPRPQRSERGRGAGEKNRFGSRRRPKGAAGATRSRCDYAPPDESPDDLDGYLVDVGWALVEVINKIFPLECYFTSRGGAELKLNSIRPYCPRHEQV